MMRRVAIAAGLLLASVSSVAMTGCASTSSGQPAMVDRDAAYAGPEITILERDGKRAVRFFTRSGGWEVIREHERRERADNALRLTLVRPDPDKMQIQALIEQMVVTNIPASKPITVLMRTVDCGADAEGVPYVVAATAGDPVEP